MIERLALVLALSIAAVAAYYALRSLHVRRMQPVASGAGVPTLLYFSSDTCAACPAQGRVVEQLATHWDGRLQIERVDADRDPETAARYSVLTLPTTILLDADGRVRHVNYGMTHTQKLNRQLTHLFDINSAAGEPVKSTIAESA